MDGGTGILLFETARSNDVLLPRACRATEVSRDERTAQPDGFPDREEPAVGTVAPQSVDVDNGERSVAFLRNIGEARRHPGSLLVLNWHQSDRPPGEVCMRAVIATFIAAAILVPACGGTNGSNPAAPTAQTLEGTWRATRAEYVSVANSSKRADVVAQGTTVTMVFAGSNYTFTQTDPGKAPQVQTGTWSASVDMMTLRPTGVSWSLQFDMTFSGNNLTLNGASVEFDFAANGVVEQAKLNLTLVR
jgi:hypothetical protein